MLASTDSSVSASTDRRQDRVSEADVQLFSSLEVVCGSIMIDSKDSLGLGNDLIVQSLS
jgi:hypothetical protein